MKVIAGIVVLGIPAATLARAVPQQAADGVATGAGGGAAGSPEVNLEGR
jgi:hypothetical protein